MDNPKTDTPNKPPAPEPEAAPAEDKPGGMIGEGDPAPNARERGGMIDEG